MPLEDFEFIDCGSLSITYNIRGDATLSFTVVSNKEEPEGNYTDLTFGGVRFTGYITNLVSRLIENTEAYDHSFQMVAVGNPA
jgi:hypothetical protein